MSTQKTQLNDTKIRTAKPDAKPYKLSDGGGLYLLVRPNGAKLWRMKYRYGGKENVASFGEYPQVGLKDARDKREKAKEQLAAGDDPNTVRKIAKIEKLTASANTFQAVSEEWLDNQAPKWTEGHLKRVRARLANHAWPKLGDLPISDIKPAQVLATLQAVKAPYMAGRVRESVSNVFCHAVATLRAESDPTASLKGALKAHVPKHMASVTDPAKVGVILRKFDKMGGSIPVKVALQLAPHVFARPGELRQMRWEHIDFKKKLWVLPAASMKQRQSHIVPLSRQALELIKSLRDESGHSDYVFCGTDPTKPISDMTLGKALRRIGIDTKHELTPHGFRAMARTLIREKLRVPAEIIECQLSHTKRGALGAAYDRTEFLDERIKMMQVWSDYLDDLKFKRNVVRMPRIRA